MRELIGIEQSKLRELLPIIARHLGEHALLAMHHLVMRKRHYIMLRKRIAEREGQLVMVIFTVDAVHAHIVEHVVHPAHVPFIRKPQSILGHRARHIGVCRTLLGEEHLAAGELVDRRIELAEERDSIQVVVSAEAVGQPFAGIFTKIVIEHGADRVHAKTVKMKLSEPIHGAGDQEGLYLRLLKVEQKRAPLRHLSPARVGMFEERRAVKEPQPVRIPCKMRGNPVHDDTDALAMCAVNEIHQLLRLAVARRRRIIASDLIAPAGIIGILHQRHNLNVGISHIDHIVDQLFRQFAVAEPLFPATKMHLVDVHWLAVGLRRAFVAVEIALVRPFVIGHIADDGRGTVYFRAECERVRF